MRRFISIVLVGAGLLVLPACGEDSDEGARAAGITPASAVAFFSVDLDPSIDQKRNLLSVVRRFPGVKDEVQGDFEDAREKLLDEITEEGGLDYVTDVKPWLGDEIALAVLSLDGARRGDTPPIVLLVETKDAEKATAAIEKSEDFDGSYRVVGDFIVIVNQEEEAERAATLDAFAAQATKDDGGLAANERFTTVVDELADDRLLLAWADGKALFEQFEDEFGGDFAFPGLSFMGDDAKSGPVAVDLHAERSAIVVDGYAVASGETGSNEPKLTASLPVDTLGALTLFDLSGIADQAAEFFIGAGGGGGSEEDPFEAFEQETGVDLRADVLSWMEGEIVITAGDFPAGRDFPDFGLIIEPTDRDKAEAGVAKIVQALADQGVTLDERQIAETTAYVVPEPFVDGIQPAMALFEDRFVLANSPAYLETLSAPTSPGFGSTDAYDAVIGEGSSSDTSFQFVLRIDPIREAIERNLSSGERGDYDAEVKANVEPLNAFGISSQRDGDIHRFSMRLTFD